MQHYRTKPQVVQAIQLNKSNIKEVAEFINKDPDENAVILDGNTAIGFGFRSSRTVYLSSWIVRQPNGKIENLKTEEFIDRYESIGN